METVTFEVLLSARELTAQCEEHESTEPSQGAATRAGKRQCSSCNSSMRTGAMRTTHPVITKSWHKCRKRLAAVLKAQLNKTPDKLQAWTCTPPLVRTSDKQKGFAKAHSAPACCAKRVCFLKEKNKHNNFIWRRNHKIAACSWLLYGACICFTGWHQDKRFLM